MAAFVVENIVLTGINRQRFHLQVPGKTCHVGWTTLSREA